MTLPSDPHAYPQPNILFIGTPQILIKPSQHLQDQNYLCKPQAHSLPPVSSYEYMHSDNPWQGSSLSIALSAMNSIAPSIINGHRSNPAIVEAAQAFLKRVHSSLSTQAPEPINNHLDWSKFICMARNPEVIDAAHAIQGISLSMSIFACHNMLDTGKIPIQNEYLKIIQKAYSLVSMAPHVNSGRPMPGKVNITFSEETFHLMDI